VTNVPARLLIPLLSIGMAGVTAALLSGCEAAPSIRLNVLLITVDTLRADRLSGYGYERATSPNIDRFMQSAVTFEDAQSNSGWTLPSLASIMTSLHPSTHGCVRFDSSLDASHVTLGGDPSCAGLSNAWHRKPLLP
jgi:arylsulfatase A-like enzyme